MYRNRNAEGFFERRRRALIDDGYTLAKQKRKWHRQAKRDEFWRKVILRTWPKRVKVQNNKIIFLNFTGNYDCNPKGIAEEIRRQGLDIEIVWGIFTGTKTTGDRFPKNVRTVQRRTYDFYKEIASSKIIVDNGVSTADLYYFKKKDQYLIETWHGSLGIKKFGKGANEDWFWHYKAERESSMTDFIISNSDFEDKVYREQFWPNTPIWKFGHPRNDVLFSDENTKQIIRAKILEYFGLEEGKKICLYAPTFRDTSDLSQYKIDYDALSNALTERFGGEWIILTRFHNATKKYLKNYVYPENTINASGYPDIQELMLVADVGITDYSSWICEYVLTRKPGFTFATDVDDYVEHQRKLYFQLDELPFPTASSEEQLINNILKFDDKKYVNRCNKFISDCGSVDDGHASERVVAEIKKLMGL